MIAFTCACGMPYQVPDNYSGRKVRCGKCGVETRVFAGSTFIAPRPSPEQPSAALEVDGGARKNLLVRAGSIHAVRIALLFALCAGMFALGGLARNTPGDPLGVLLGMRTRTARTAVAPAARRLAPAKPVEPRPAPAEPVAQNEEDRSRWPQEVRVAEAFFRRHADDPSHVEVVEWWKPIPGGPLNVAIPYDKVIYIVFRSKNRFGALAVSSHIFLFQDGQVVYDKTDFAEWELNMVYQVGPDPNASRKAMNTLVDQNAPATPGKKIKP